MRGTPIGPKMPVTIPKQPTEVPPKYRLKAATIPAELSLWSLSEWINLFAYQLGLLLAMNLYSSREKAALGKLSPAHADSV